MLAVVGYFVTHAGVCLSGNIHLSGTKFADTPGRFDAFNNISSAGIAQLVVLVGFLELAVMKDVTSENKFFGDFCNGSFDLGWDTFDE